MMFENGIDGAVGNAPNGTPVALLIWLALVPKIPVSSIWPGVVFAPADAKKRNVTAADEVSIAAHIGRYGCSRTAVNVEVRSVAADDTLIAPESTTAAPDGSPLTSAE